MPESEPGFQSALLLVVHLTTLVLAPELKFYESQWEFCFTNPHLHFLTPPKSPGNLQGRKDLTE